MAPITKVASLVAGLSCSLGGVVAGICSNSSNTQVSQVSSPTVEEQVPTTTLNQSSENTKNLSDADNSSVKNTKKAEETLLTKEEKVINPSESLDNLQRELIKKELEGKITKEDLAKWEEELEKERCRNGNTMKNQGQRGLNEFINTYCLTTTAS